MVEQGLKVVLIINLIIIDHSRMIQAFRFIEISKYDGGQVMPRSNILKVKIKKKYLLFYSILYFYIVLNLCQGRL